MIVIIVPFIFWGMGGAFSGGNTNTIAKINNHNVSTQDFVNYIETSNKNKNVIKENIDKNILEELLSELISQTLLDLEIKDLNIKISDVVLAKKIKNNKNFFDEKNNFSRIKYEKFLISNNISAPEFEQRFKKSELQKQLFAYVSGGLKPPYFLINNTFKEQTKLLDIEYINLEENYKKKNQFPKEELKKFIDDNKEKLKENYVDFNFIKITPQKLIGLNEFNELFFNKIDEIENKILEGLSLIEIENFLKLKSKIVKNFNLKENENLDDEERNIYKKIYSNIQNKGVNIIESSDYFILYEINNVSKILPKIDEKFSNKIINILYQKEKFNFNQNLFNKINNKKFTDKNFLDLAKNNKIENIRIKSINDNVVFSNDSIKLLYSLPLNTYTLINDEDNNIYLAKINNYETSIMSKNLENYKKFDHETKIKIRNDIYSSYDYFLNDKYKVEINQKSLERVKNFFR